MASENLLMQQLQDLQKQLSKKQRFEEAVFSIEVLLRENYPSASPALQKLAGLGLFEQAELLVSDYSQKEYFRSCIAGANEQLRDIYNRAEGSESSLDSRPNRGYLFEGHLTVDQEPPHPNWLTQQNMLSNVGTLLTAQASDGHVDSTNTSDIINGLIEEMLVGSDFLIPEGVVAHKVPPASKEVVAMLPVTVLTEDTLNLIGEAECAICKERFAVNDNMQELPCKHTFHPPCLKPWLDEHNSCPICRHELKTDDHVYESKKEREKEAEEERKGAANAVREGEFMYV